MKVMTVLGTRPEIIRLSRVMPLLDEHTDHVLVHTGQNWDQKLNDVFFDELRLRPPRHRLPIRTDTLGTLMGDILRTIEPVLAAERPDAFLVLGDTNSAISAIMAKRMHVPVYHMEAGNRSFDENVPEETNRRLVDHISDFNPPTPNMLAATSWRKAFTLAGSPSPALRCWRCSSTTARTSRGPGRLLILV
jgi:UDP-N-acetylglucosamine 2-epimerase